MYTCALLILSFVFLINGQPNTNCDVAIIGGGSAGANTAMFIRQALPNADICLIEKTDRLGGHCQTKYLPTFPAGAPYWIELGVQAIVNTTQTNLAGLSNASLRTDVYLASIGGLSLSRIDFTQANPSQVRIAADTRSNFQILLPNVPPSPQLAAQFAAFFQYLAQYPWLSGEWPTTIPTELVNITWSEWLVLNQARFGLLYPFFDALLQSGGLGTYNLLTAVYGLQAVEPTTIQLFTPNLGGMAFNGGCATLYTRIHQILGSSVFLNTQVTSIDRNGNGARPVVINTPTRTFRSRFLVLALPQTLANLDSIGLDRSPAETAVFTPVKTRGYYTSLTQTPDQLSPLLVNKPFLINNYNLSNIGSGILLPTSYPNIHSCQRVLPYGPSTCKGQSDDPNLSLPTMQGVFTSALANLTNSPTLNPGSYSIQLSEFYQHEGYQPYFPAEVLQSSVNPYQVIKNLQGVRRTYYVGSLVTYASSARVWDHAYRLVNSVVSQMQQ